MDKQQHQLAKSKDDEIGTAAAPESRDEAPPYEGLSVPVSRAAAAAEEGQGRDQDHAADAKQLLERARALMAVSSKIFLLLL